MDTETRRYLQRLTLRHLREKVARAQAERERSHLDATEAEFERELQALQAQITRLTRDPAA